MASSATAARSRLGGSLGRGRDGGAAANLVAVRLAGGGRSSSRRTGGGVGADFSTEGGRFTAGSFAVAGEARTAGAGGGTTGGGAGAGAERGAAGGGGAGVSVLRS